MHFEAGVFIFGYNGVLVAIQRSERQLFVIGYWGGSNYMSWRLVLENAVRIFAALRIFVQNLTRCFGIWLFWRKCLNIFRQTYLFPYSKIKGEIQLQSNGFATIAAFITSWRHWLIGYGQDPVTKFTIWWTTVFNETLTVVVIFMSYLKNSFKYDLMLCACG